LDQPARWAREGQRDQAPENASHHQPEHVSPEVHPLSRRSQHRQECESSGGRGPGAAAAGTASPASDQSHAAENPDRAEDGGGGAHREVEATAKPGVQEIAAGAGCEHQGAAEALAPASTHRRHEERTGDGVGQDVGEIRVKGERGDAPPDLSEENSPGIGTAPLEPDRSLAPGTGHQEECQQPYRDREPGDQLARHQGLGGGERRAAVLAHVGGEDLQCPLLLMGRDAEGKATPLADHDGRETLGDQHQGPLFGESAGGSDPGPAFPFRRAHEIGSELPAPRLRRGEIG